MDAAMRASPSSSALFAAPFALVALFAPAAGCGGDVDEEPKTGNDGGTVVLEGGSVQDASSSADGSVDGGSGTPACYAAAAAPAPGPSGTVAKATPGACTAGEVAQLAAACIGANASQAACDGVGASTACTECMYSTNRFDGDGLPIRPAIAVRGTLLRPDVEACQAVLLGAVAGVPEGCGDAFAQESDCLLGTCATCDSGELGACERAAALDEDGAGPLGACAPVVLAPSSPCGAALAAKRAEIDAACTGSDATTRFVNVGTVLCVGRR
jgi:hypothetical protein